jgi:hypothetical protein
MGSNPIHTTMTRGSFPNPPFQTMVDKFLPEAKYRGYRRMAYFEYNEEKSIFETKSGFYLTIENPQDLTKTKVEDFYEVCEKYLGIKVLLESDDAASIF